MAFDIFLSQIISAGAGAFGVNKKKLQIECVQLRFDDVLSGEHLQQVPQSFSGLVLIGINDRRSSLQRIHTRHSFISLAECFRQSFPLRVPDDVSVTQG